MRAALATLFLAACGGSHAPDCVAAGPATTYAIHAITLPQSSNDFALDLNGDGHADDRLGNIVGALTMNMIDPQAALGIALDENQIRPRVTLAPVRVGSTTPMVFTIGEAGAPSQPVCVAQTADHLATPEPSKAVATIAADLPVPFATAIPLQLVRVSLTVDGNNQLEGMVSAAIRAQDIARFLIPAFADYLQARIGVVGVVEDYFDTGGSDDGSGCRTQTACTNLPAGQPACRNPAWGVRASECADQCDLIIDTCEVATNQLTKNLLAPDVQLFDDNGNWAPSRDDKRKDALSVAFGITGQAVTP